MRIVIDERCNAADIATRLGDIVEPGDEQLELVLREDAFIYPSGISWLTALLVRWKEAGTEVVVDGSANTAVAGYLARMGFFDHLDVDEDHSSGRQNPGGRFLPLMPIDDEDDAHEAVNRILDLLLMHFDGVREVLPGIEWALCEITDNVVIHADAPTPGFVSAQFYPKKDMLTVAISDAGRGIRDTLGEAHDVESDERAIELAMQRGITRGLGQGNGIAGTREILQVNGGGFAIWSGSVHHYEDGDHDRYREIPRLPGTGIQMRFETSRPIDLRETFIESATFTYIESLAERYDERDESLEVARQSSGFGGRPPARRLRRKILALLPDMEYRLTLDFAGVESVSSSYIDELLGKLIEELGADDYEQHIRVVNMAPSVARRADVTITQRLEKTVDQTTDAEPELWKDVPRPAPELEFEGWLAIHPGDLERDPEKVIENFCFRWEIDLDDEVMERMRAVFEKMRAELESEEV